MTRSSAADPRRELLERWLRDELRLSADRIAPASADASFRRYFRVWQGTETLIVMDAPPDREDLAPYLHVAGLLGRIGVHVPRVLERDEARGFLLLTDLGSRQYLDELKGGGDAGALYGDALDALARIQSAGAECAAELPPYDAALLSREMELFPEWFLGRHLGIAPEGVVRGLLDRAFSGLAAAALAQPATFVHRDYHSRNLMLFPGDNPGILDFQDAVRGAVTYDLVSLLKDCYIAWPRARVEAWVASYRSRAAARGVPVAASLQEFLRWFDLMGVQRHVKVLGIFARLWYRDGKRGYLDDLPLVLDYTLAATAMLPELAEFDAFLRETVVPAFPEAQRRAGART
jgi:hypothetical protein